jgi:hypothetical protein
MSAHQRQYKAFIIGANANLIGPTINTRPGFGKLWQSGSSCCGFAALLRTAF